ncbi:MAG: (d)CMP kinase [Bacillota bacterium]|nr:(d)CMP kinase [Bacillota bacterium]
MISVAIDGPSGAGKSTISRCAAKVFGFIYVDTGALYRTIGLAAFRRGYDTKDKSLILPMLPELNIELKYNENGEQRMYLDGEDVSSDIRLPEISMCASNVSAMQEVRNFLTDMQRGMAKKYNVIMDGRDIGTVILPDADVKIFLTASLEARAMRRYKELLEKGVNDSFEEVMEDMKMRDYQDTNRAAAPLAAAVDAVTLDTSDYDFDESLRRVCGIISEKTGIKAAN